MMKFKYKNKEYEIGEVTIDMWSKLMVLQEWTDETEFSIKLLSFLTGLTEEEIMNTDYTEIVKLTEQISTYLYQDKDKFYNEFEFNNKKYRFLDLPNLTFGEFIDIDTFLSREPQEKKKDMNLLMAMLYREVDENGKYKPYNSKEIQLKGEEFRKLPVKYLNGASSFFLRLEKILSGNLRGSFFLKLKLILKMIYLSVKFSLLISIGLGLGHLYLWLKKILPKWKK